MRRNGLCMRTKTTNDDNFLGFNDE
jgi:hypothetical protein